MKGIKMKKSSIITYIVAIVFDLALTVFNVQIGSTIAAVFSSFSFGATGTALLCILLFVGVENGNETTDHPKGEK